MATVYGFPIEALIFFGLLLKVAGFAVRDELWLRGLVAAGMVLDVAYYALRPEPILQSVVSNGIMVAINTLLILLILHERTTFRMSAEARDLYRAFPTLSPGHFRKLYRHVRWRETQTETVLLHADLPVHELYYVFTDRYTIRKDGVPYETRGPAFVGEIALLTGRTSSATVELPPGTRYVMVPFDHIRRLMAKSQAFHNSMVALFAKDLARKVASSAPIERQPMRSPTVGPRRNGAAADKAAPRPRAEAE